MTSGPPAATPTGAGDLPRIAIERTPANDVYLILSAIGMGGEAERALADPLAFLRDNRAEARFVAQYLKGRLEPPAGERRHHGADPDRHPRAGTPSTDLRRTSLLR